AVTVGQISGRQTQALQRLPARAAPQWLDLAPRLWYPVMILLALLSIVVFLMIFIVPKYEKMFEDFHLRLPETTHSLISVSRSLTRFPWIVPLLGLLIVSLFNVMLFSSRAKWYFPVVGRYYRMYARGQFM